MTVSTADLERLVSLLSAVASEDISGLSRAALVDRLEWVGKVSRTVGAVEARYAGEVARRTDPDLPGGGLARGEGHGDAPTMFSKFQGGTVPRARSTVEAGDAFTPIEDNSAPIAEPSASTEPQQAPAAKTRPKYPLVAGAQMVGDLAVEAAAAIVKGLNELAGRVSNEALTELETRFVNKARTLNVAGVKRMVARAVARVDVEEHRKREQVNHEQRYFWWKQDHTGKVVFHGEMDAVTAAPILTVLEQMATLQVRQQSRPDQFHETAGDGEVVERRTIGQIRADALHDLARHALDCEGTQKSGVRTSLVIRMTREQAATGEGLASIDGIATPVSAREAMRLAGDACTIPEVVDRDGTVLNWGRRKRLFTGAQRTALLGRDGGCARCHAPPEHCESHHIVFWAMGGRSDLENGVMLCTRCHHDIHTQGWQVAVTAGRVHFVPPAHLDPTRTPQPGGDAVFDIDLGGIHLLGNEPLPPVTPEDEAFIRALDREAWALEDAWHAAHPNATEIMCA